MTVTTGDYAQLESRLARMVSGYAQRRDTTDVQFALSCPSRGWTWAWSAPSANRRYFIASATKLYVTALIMRLRADGRLELDSPASHFLPAGILRGIHVLRGHDFGERITVRELLAHTSGVADYFEQKRRDGTTQIGRAIDSDFSWTFDDVLRITRDELTPRFAPSTPGKASYSDTNYQILGAIIERMYDAPLERVIDRELVAPLGLRDTWLFTADTVARYDDVAPMLYGTKRLTIPNAMASVRADGGLVSSADDGIRFLEAFMGGRIFPKAWLDDMQRHFNPIFTPLEYGVGIMRFALPRYYTLFTVVPPMVGHSGASGAVLYYVPSLDLHVSGTVNQAKKRSLSYGLMTRLVMACAATWR